MATDFSGQHTLKIAKVLVESKGDGGKEMKIKLNIVGMTWKTELNAEVEGEKITFDRKEFDQVMGIIAETHDAVSGGFQIVETREE